MTQTDQPADGVAVVETGGGAFQVMVRTADASFLADEPVRVGGLGSGPDPYDLLCAALGACTVMTLRLYAGRKGWPLVRAGVTVLHSRPAGAGADHFAREIMLTGDLSDDQRCRLLEIADKCPVHRTLAGGAEIVTVLTTQSSCADTLPSSGQHAAAMSDTCADQERG